MGQNMVVRGESRWIERPRQRVGAVDVVRGLAVVCMIVDHFCLVLGGPEVLRLTVGRAAMPLFFVTAGYCVQRSGRLRWRHAEVALVGLLLPVVVPWIDDPNVLFWWAWGCALLVLARYAGISPVVLGIASAGVLANGWSADFGHSYDPHALFVLMAFGAMLPASWWAWGDRLRPQRTLAWFGRHALPVYVGHVLALTAVGTWL